MQATSPRIAHEISPPTHLKQKLRNVQSAFYIINAAWLKIKKRSIQTAETQEGQIQTVNQPTVHPAGLNPEPNGGIVVHFPSQNKQKALSFSSTHCTTCLIC